MTLRVTMRADIGPYAKRFRIIDENWQKRKYQIMAFIGREIKKYMKTYIISKGKVSPIKKKGKHLHETIKVERADKEAIRVYPTAPYAIYVDEGARSSPGRYVPYLGLPPGMKINIRAVEERHIAGVAEQKFKLIQEKGAPIPRAKRGRRPRRTIRQQARAEFWKRPEFYGKGKRLVRAKVLGVHPGQKGIRFSRATHLWAMTELPKIMRKEMHQIITRK